MHHYKQQHSTATTHLPGLQNNIYVLTPVLSSRGIYYLYEITCNALTQGMAPSRVAL